MEGRLVNRKCDAMLMMHASYFSMHAQCAQAGCGFDVDGEKRRPPPAQRHVVLFGWAVHVFLESSFSNLKLSNSHVRSS